MEIVLSPPFVANIFIGTFALFFTAAAGFSFVWALVLVIFSLNNLTTCSSPELLSLPKFIHYFFL